MCTHHVNLLTVCQPTRDVILLHVCFHRISRISSDTGHLLSGLSVYSDDFRHWPSSLIVIIVNSFTST